MITKNGNISHPNFKKLVNFIKTINMKKIFLTLALVFVTGTVMNATSNNLVVEERDCIGMAFDAEKRAGVEFSYAVFSAIVEACEAMQ